MSPQVVYQAKFAEANCQVTRLLRWRTISGLLMRVDEQADPIDRPLPIVDDRLDVQALERVAPPEQQAVPYLALLVTTIYGDAEKAFGRDKAKRGYKAAQQQVFGPDTSALGGPDLAGKLPRV